MTGSHTPPRPEWLAHVPLDGLLRIDLGMEGDWSGTVRPVWSAERGTLALPGDEFAHHAHRPALELYFEGVWIGIHCFAERDSRFVFNRARAEEIVRFVERRRATD